MTDHRPSPAYDPAPAIEYDYSLNLNRLNRALYYSAGVDVQLLKHCPNYDRVKLQGIGGTVMATAMLAFISGSYAFYTVFGPNSVDKPDEVSLLWMAVACFFGMVWATVIYNLDRFIVSTTGHGDGTDNVTFGELLRALPRILMAVLIGIVLSKPLEIRIMKTEIDAALKIEQQVEAQKYIDNAKGKRDLAVTNLNVGKDELVKQKDKKLQEVETLRLQSVKSQQNYDDEMNGKTGGRGTGKGPVADAKKALMDKDLATLEEAKARIQPEIAELQARIKEKELETDQENKKFQEATADAKVQGERLNGLIKRIEIAHKVSPNASKFLTAMLIFIEISPLFFKMMLTLSSIDYLTENQKRLARIRRGIAVGYSLDAKGEAILDVKEATYHEADLEATRTIGKLEIDRKLTAQVQEEFTRIVSDDISKNPSGYIDRLPPAST